MRDRVVPGLALAAELGHLVAAWTEAEAWPLISGFHIAVAYCWGFVFAGLRKPRPRKVTVGFAVVLAVSLPLMYLFTRTVGLPTYVTFTRLPTGPVGVVVSLTEVALAVALLAMRRRPAPDDAPAPASAESPRSPSDDRASVSTRD